MELRPYGVACRVDFPLITTGSQDFKASATLAAGDFQIASGTLSGALGAFGNPTTTTPTDEGSYYSLPLTAAEMQTGRMVLLCIDAAGAEWEDQSLTILTVGHPDAGIPQMGVPSYDEPGAGTPTAADATTVTLPVGASSDDDAYIAVIMVESGKPTKMMWGAYVGSTRVFTYDPAPGITYTTAAVVYPVAVPANATSDVPPVDATKISGDATAADNAELFFDGTGYAGTNNVIPTVTTLTGHTAQTGDSYAALTGAQAEPGQGAPAVNAGPLTKLAYLFKAWTNKSTQDATSFELYNAAGAVVDQKATVGEAAGVVTKGEVVSGP